MKSSLAQMQKCARVHRFESAMHSAMHNQKTIVSGMLSKKNEIVQPKTSIWPQGKGRASPLGFAARICACYPRRNPRKNLAQYIHRRTQSKMGTFPVYKIVLQYSLKIHTKSHK